MISIIIPTYNEEGSIGKILSHLRNCSNQHLLAEIIVADGGSSDATEQIVKAAQATFLKCPGKGRSAQMNFGAQHSSAPVLYFLHADTLPPLSFLSDIQQCIHSGFDAGCFMLSFDHSHWFLRANCWFTRFNVDAVRFGDQSLFVREGKFDDAGGFCENHIVLEDQELIKRIKRIGKFCIVKKAVITSARKYLENGIYKTQGIFFLIYLMYRLGYSQQKLLFIYRRLIRQDKL